MLLATLPQSEQDDWLATFTDDELQCLQFDWLFWARREQMPPDVVSGVRWRIWLVLAGRGFGKTRTGAETVRYWIEDCGANRIALVGATAADVRDVMVEGESGILAVSPPHFRPVYEPSKRRVTWPNGAFATTYSADEPERLRGPQHEKAWSDEIASWRYGIAHDMLMFGLRLGDNPQEVVTGTPKPVELIIKLAKDPKTILTGGSSYENRGNVSEDWFLETVDAYKDTRLGQQEIFAQILDDNPDALWKRATIEKYRVQPEFYVLTSPTEPSFIVSASPSPTEHLPDADVSPTPTGQLLPSGGYLRDYKGDPMTLDRIVVGVDPQVADPDQSVEQTAETGIIAAGVKNHGTAQTPDYHYYVLDDRSLRDHPLAWGTVVVVTFDDYKADRICAEQNNGGALVEANIRQCAKDANVQIAYTGVHAARGKVTRAEPVATLYEMGRVHHVGLFPHLEGQMCNWIQGQTSPDRMDALVWAITLLSGKGQPNSVKRGTKKEGDYGFA